MAKSFILISALMHLEKAHEKCFILKLANFKVKQLIMVRIRSLPSCLYDEFLNFYSLEVVLPLIASEDSINYYLTNLQMKLAQCFQRGKPKKVTSYNEFTLKVGSSY